MKIGFCSYSETSFDIQKANEIIKTIKQNISDDDEIVSGATMYGIPKLVYNYFNKNKKIGIMCKQGYDCELYPCDVIYSIGDNWGDESEFFIKYIDVLYKIGGGKQSIKEMKMAKERGIPVIEYYLERYVDIRN